MARGLTAARAVAVALAALAMATLVSSCSNSNALGLAKQACTHVSESVTAYRQSVSHSGTAMGAAEQAKASAQLQLALPIAATAAGEAPQWQALMMTLSESERIPESRLIYALSAQCAVADTNGVPPAVSPPTS